MPSTSHRGYSAPSPTNACPDCCTPAGSGPDPHVFHLVYRLVRGDHDRAHAIVDQAPDVLDEGSDYQLVTYELDVLNEPA